MSDVGSSRTGVTSGPVRLLARAREAGSDPVHVLSMTLCALPVLLLVVLGAHRRWLADDSLINARIVENLLQGHGPVFNVGERVEAGTSTLWVLLLWLGTAASPFDASTVSWILGLALATVGLGLAAVAAARLARADGGAAVVYLPVGLAVLAALPPMWDFMTSGLETGLTFAWLATSYSLLVFRVFRYPGRCQPADRPFWIPVVLGLGPLIRPDLALVSLAFAYALLRQSDFRIGSLVRAGAWFGLLPVAYEVFRAGYYANLVPNTGLAKAGSSNWDVGMTYLLDLVGRYWLVVPAVVVYLGLLRPAMRRTATDPGLRALYSAPLAGAAAHAVFVVSVGGDFMHARLLLPALFCALLPVMAVAVTAERRPVHPTGLMPVGFVVLIGWAVVVGLTVRPELVTEKTSIADERSLYVLSSGGVAGDLDREDVARNPWYREGAAAQQRAESGIDLFFDTEYARDYPGVPGDGLVHRRGPLGQFGYAAPSVFIADQWSLADPVGARLDVPLPAVPRVGHNQVVPLSWHLARFTPPSDEDSAETRAARAALQCGALADLVEATSEPMNAGLFLDNLLHAVGYTRLSVPGDPIEAEGELC